MKHLRAAMTNEAGAPNVAPVAQGASIIGGIASARGASHFRAVDPRTGQARDLVFADATEDEVNQAVGLACAAFEELEKISDNARAGLLERIAANIAQLGDTLIDAAHGETGLPRPRLIGERARTCDQLMQFAQIIRAGIHLDVIIDTARSDGAQPPSPDLRRTTVPLGPVVIFSASNFPLAFSVAGGDTASALAAGCPVIVKAHPAHPETSELTARAVAEAVEDLGLPPGMFSLLQGAQHAPGHQLVTHPGVSAVGFTGSEAGGRALWELAMERPIPIPVFAEMGSLNPVVVTQAALAARATEIAEGLANSILLGAGQFCTKPGFVLLPDGPDTEAFVDIVVQMVVTAAPPHYLLSESIRERFLDHAKSHLEPPPAGRVWRGPMTDGITAPGMVTLLRVSDLSRTPHVFEEHFGPSCVLAVYDSSAGLTTALDMLPSGLTATVHAQPHESPGTNALISALRGKVGRLIWNQFPTGVTVAGSMHHGGPYPGSSVSAHTSVGWTALRRFQRPVTYQNFPDDALPAALKDANPLGLTRRVDGELTDRQLHH
jgi:acyl-CoA reductase-like NAD-dependent aldehyde dehydrogenase